MNSRIEVILTFAVYAFVGHLAEILIALVIAAFIVPKLLKNTSSPLVRTLAYAAFGAVGGTLGYADQTGLSETPATDVAIVSSIFFVGTALLVAPFVYFRSRRSKARA